MPALARPARVIEAVRGYYLRRNMMTRTMIKMITIVPTPIYME
jgi:hypothetical protein